MDVQKLVKAKHANIPIFIDDNKEIETCLVSLSPKTSFDNDCINLSPGEGKPFYMINSVKNLVFNFFPSRKFGYRVQRDLNSTLLNISIKGFYITVKNLLQNPIVF